MAVADLDVVEVTDDHSKRGALLTLNSLRAADAPPSMEAARAGSTSPFRRPSERTRAGYLKNTPLRSRPMTAPTRPAGFAGSEINWKPDEALTDDHSMAEPVA